MALRRRIAVRAEVTCQVRNTVAITLVLSSLIDHCATIFYKTYTQLIIFSLELQNVEERRKISRINESMRESIQREAARIAHNRGAFLIILEVNYNILCWPFPKPGMNLFCYTGALSIYSANKAQMSDRFVPIFPFHHSVHLSYE